ncbi:ribonuclease 3 [Gigaspora margarita]|uniref:Ribonuclease 3 n=1 Tax=Gigaspora margarita TaxID=4874 RepID=A0A8H4AUB4_GIGMA|nr:ribonuclease 3 [Gigaspora margarita]
MTAICTNQHTVTGSQATYESEATENQPPPPVPEIQDPLFKKLATCCHLYKGAWETLEFLGDRIITSCIWKIAEPKYLKKYCARTVLPSIQHIATNKILAAYCLKLGIYELNGMSPSKIKKRHADAFETYFGAFYLTNGELETCIYLDRLMTPLLDLIVGSVASGKKEPKDSYEITSNYFGMQWILDISKLTKRPRLGDEKRAKLKKKI